MTKVNIRIFASLALAALLMSACGDDSEISPGGDSGVVGNTATLAFTDGGATLDPRAAHGAVPNTILLASYNTLVTNHIGEDGNQVDGEYDPALAESWEVSEDDLTWTFNLRNDVTFQSGNEFTAADVLWSFEGFELSSLYQLANIESVEAIDEHTVEFQLHTPQPVLPDYFGMMSIMDSAYLENEVDDIDSYLASNAAGSGPYILESWDPSSEAVLTANPDYWGEEPAIQQFTLRFVSEMTTQIQQLQQDDVQLIISIPPQNLADLEDDENIEVIAADAGNTEWLSLNVQVEPFDDVAVRQALAWATPYEEVIDSVLMGYGQRLESAISPITPHYASEVWEYEYDPSMAREVLEQAGYSEGDISFDAIVNNGDPFAADTATILQDAYAEVGIDMSVQTLNSSQYEEQFFDSQALIGNWLSYINQPQYHFGWLLDSEGAANFSNYENPEFDEIVRTAEFEDEEIQAELWSEAQAILAEDVPWIYLYAPDVTVAHSSNLSGYYNYVSVVPRLHELYYED
ncbi:ABC transporter substrate-binding protein [Nesterenkonia muleiensis]|uniref:ABC transporter substrate-binding protein n=1 Tax=Nesterenkonia muleiensis TaxID=2282648 RepID=UPI000E717A61|nr:ABC transporter substrate-binding protein [Nesterenkonia muleiensis]